MNKLIYKIELLSDWHCGSGLSAGADVDLLCIKDKIGLPFIPGKTLKGLLKEAAEVIFGTDSEFYKKCFGSEPTITENDGSGNCSKGECYFSNAELSLVVKKEFVGLQKLPVETLYRKISSTAIDDNGVAIKHSLRKIEVAAPLTLYAEISGVA